MHVLVTAASRYEATAELARAIARTLESRGLDVTTRPPDDVSDLTGFDAVVLGSAVYAGRWLEEARRFGEQFVEALIERDVWVFSSGPVGDRVDVDQPIDAIELAAAIGAHDLALFGGRVERVRLNRAERTILRLMRVRDSDDRDWDQVGAWAETIADSLNGTRGRTSE